MSIHQTKDGRWFVAFRDKGSRAVKRKYFGHGPDGKVAAKKYEGDLLSDRQSGREPAAALSSLTFRGLAQKYLEARPLTKRTRESIGYALNLYVLERWGHLPVSELTMAHLAELDETLARAGRSVATRNRYRAYCKSICQWGRNNDLISNNPFAKFRAEVKKEGKAPDLLTGPELSAIHKHASPHLRWAIEVMMNTGVRPGPTELFAMKMSDVDCERGGIWIKRHKTRSPQELLPLRPEFMTQLKNLAASEPGRRYLIEYEGRPVTSLKTAWRACLRRAGITRRLRLYDLRHWYASQLLSGGADLKATSQLMGHASPSTTMNTYYHLLDDQKRKALAHLTLPDLNHDEFDGADKKLYDGP